MQSVEEQLGLSEEKLAQLYANPEFDKTIAYLEETSPRFKALADNVKKLSMAVFLQGDITKIEGMWKLFYKRSIPSIEDFLTKEYIGMDHIFYDQDSLWRKDLLEIFKQGSTKWEWCLSGCIGAGKFAVSTVAHFYNLYRITSLRNPQMAIGPGGSKPMSLFVVSISKRKATDGLQKFKIMLKDCKYFHQVKKQEEFANFEAQYQEIVPYCFVKEDNQEKIAFPNNVYIETGSKLDHSISSDIFGASFDEAEFKNGAEAAAKMFDFYTELHTRISSRFIDTNFKFITLISSVKSDTGVIAKHIEKIKFKQDVSHLSMYAIWEVKPEYKNAFKKFGHFYVLRGNKTHPTRILDEDGEYEAIEKGLLEAPEGCKIVKAPKHPTVLSSFKVNPDRALRDLAGEFAAGGERPFDDLSKLEDPNLRAEIHFIASLKDKVTLFSQLPDTLFTKTPDGLTLKRYPNAPRYMHLDLGEVGTAGISICHKEIGPNNETMIVFDFYGKITSPDRISLAKIEEFVVDLTIEGGVNLVIISADQYQSTHMRQRLETDSRIRAQVVKTPMGGETNIEPYNVIGTMISDGIIKVGPCIELKDQLKGVYIFNDRIQHETDRKDIVDTVLGSIYIAINNGKDIPYHSYEAFDQINLNSLKIASLEGFNLV